MVRNRPVDAVAAVSRRMTHLVRRTEDLVTVCVADLCRRLHANGKGTICGTLPSACLAVLLAVRVKAAVVLSWISCVAHLRGDLLPGHRLESSRRILCVTCLSDRISQRQKDLSDASELCRAQHTIDVRVKLQEEGFRLGDVLNLDTFDSKSFSAFAESRKAHWKVCISRLCPLNHFCCYLRHRRTCAVPPIHRWRIESPVLT
mmetsp:Transcript_18833/g.44728  ORF Transcript_18833/g.44728 Transcript_18833/m.44728 type:complete len:203 (-) Transcript_18833:479-1087(-)